MYRFSILRDPMVNAFALPNGSIYVNTGLLAAMENDGQLAAVLAHEITHVTDRHAYLQNRSVRKKLLAVNLLGLAANMASYGAPMRSVFGASIWAASSASQFLIVLTVFGYSREQEREADEAGYGRLIGHDYDGRAMAQAFEVLDEKLEFEPIEPFWRMHSKLKERIETAKEAAAAENTKSPRAVKYPDYLGVLTGVIHYNATQDLLSRRARTALARISRLMKVAPNDLVSQTLEADSYRELGAKTEKPSEEELSKEGQRENRKRTLKLTEEEEQRALAATTPGKETLAANRGKAELAYRRAVAEDARWPDSHRGLGLLYEDEGRYTEAAHEYREYLRLAAPDAIDRLRIERRLQRLAVDDHK